VPKAVNRNGFYDKHNCPQHDSIPGPHALQLDMLPLDHCDHDDDDIKMFVEDLFLCNPANLVAHSSHS